MMAALCVVLAANGGLSSHTRVGECVEGLPVPRTLCELMRHVHNTKWQLIRRRQQLNRSYKEVCAPVIDRCR